MYPKIGTFELLFQKAGKRTFTYCENTHSPEPPRYKTIFIDIPNIVYCYSCSYDIKDILFVVGTEKHINSIDDILNNQNERVYGIDIPNTVYNTIGGFVSIGTCINNAGVLHNVDNAAYYFLNSKFSWLPIFDLHNFNVYKEANQIKLSTFKEFFKFLKG